MNIHQDITYRGRLDPNPPPTEKEFAEESEVMEFSLGCCLGIRGVLKHHELHHI